MHALYALAPTPCIRAIVSYGEGEWWGTAAAERRGSYRYTFTWSQCLKQYPQSFERYGPLLGWLYAILGTVGDTGSVRM